LFGRLFFDFFLKKIKKQTPKHHFISPPEAAKYFLHKTPRVFIFSIFMGTGALPVN
jgi:hypothetical protein